MRPIGILAAAALAAAALAWLVAVARRDEPAHVAPPAAAAAEPSAPVAAPATGVAEPTEPEAADGAARAPEVAAVPAESTAAPPAPASEEASELRARLETALDTFLTREPDYASLRSCVEELAARATIVEGSVAVDEDGGRVSGELDLGGISGRATFELDDEGGTIGISDWYETPTEERPHRWRKVTIEYVQLDGRPLEAGVIGVQHHVDYRDAALLPEGESIVGWIFRSNTQAGTAGAPLTVERVVEDGETGIRVGNPRSDDFARIDRSWDWDLRAWEPWSELLGPHAPPR